MNIGHCIYHSCSRVHKLAVAQVCKGHKCYLVNSYLSPGIPWHVYEAAMRVFNWGEEGGDSVSGAHVKRAIEILDPHVDIWHCHNQPDWWVPLVKQVTKKPVIYDIHDRTSLIRPELSTEMEEESIKLADGILTVSPKYLEEIRDKYNIKKPSAYYYSMMPYGLLSLGEHEKECDVIYTGNLSTEKKRDLRSTFKFMVKSGINLRVFASDKTGRDNYLKSGLEAQVIRESVPFMKMLREVRKASIGFVGAQEPSDIMDGVAPNKFWEYLSCGVPVIVMNMPSIREQIVENGLGVYITHNDAIIGAVNDIEKNYEEYRENVEGYIKDHVMESQMKKIELFYGLVESNAR